MEEIKLEIGEKILYNNQVYKIHTVTKAGGIAFCGSSLGFVIDKLKQVNNETYNYEFVTKK